MSEKKYFIYSTLAASVNYDNHSTGGGDLPVPSEPIVIQGGANIPDKYMRTPDGAVVTPVTEAQLEALKLNPVFQLHEKNGFIKISDKKHDTEKVAADMEGRDNSAPLVEGDFQEGQAPTVNGTPNEDDAPKPTAKTNGRRA